MVFLATDVRPPRGGDGDVLVRLASETGAAGIHLARGVDLSVMVALATSALRAGLAVASVALPFPERPLTLGRRLPRLAAASRDEREAAVALTGRGIGAAIGVGARLAVLDFGGVSLATPAADVARAYARRELDEGDPGARLFAAAIDERRARSVEVMDACRWALESLVRIAEPVGATLVLPVGATPWDAPSPREATMLRSAFAGAPIGLAWDPGRLSVLRWLGLPLSDERLRELASSAALAIENDAVGVAAGYLPGLGERESGVAALTPSAATPVVIEGTPDATDDEVAAAVTAHVRLAGGG
jgi:hypothetical protein